MLCVTDYFTKSLEIIENSTICKLGYGFLFTFHSNYGHIFVGHFDAIHEHDSQV